MKNRNLHVIYDLLDKLDYNELKLVVDRTSQRKKRKNRNANDQNTNITLNNFLLLVHQIIFNR